MKEILIDVWLLILFSILAYSNIDSGFVLGTFCSGIVIGIFILDLIIVIKRKRIENNTSQ